LQFFRILHYTLWAEGDYHNTIGRFDVFAYPYLEKDMEAGRLSKEQAADLLEEFFLSFNWDNDKYIGVQLGDNGQSMVLGGVDADGKVMSVITYYTDDDHAASRDIHIDFGKPGQYEVYLLDEDHAAAPLPVTGDLTFTMADTNVATVANGAVTGVAEGDTTLTIAGPSGSNVDPIVVGVAVLPR
jgi:hypothetical protein